jgi:hypothetical protein
LGVEVEASLLLARCRGDLPASPWQAYFLGHERMSIGTNVPRLNWHLKLGKRHC